MGLSGLEIYKQLPKTNCKECGMPTCLAFAMKLAAKQAELSACPYVSEAAKQALDAASAPPIRLVTVGTGDKKVEVGNETVMFRHDKTFYHAPGLFVRVKDNQADAAAVAKKVSTYQVERVGVMMAAAGLAVENASGDAAKFAAAAEAVSNESKMPLILIAQDPAAFEAALAKLSGVKPLLYAATATNCSAMVEVAKKAKVPLAVKGDGDLQSLANLADSVKGSGVEDIVLDPGARDFLGSLTLATQIRRLAVKKNFRPLGYPVIAFPGEGASAEEEPVLAAQAIAKYAGFIVLDHFTPARAYALLVLRQNLFTDPQKPIQVQPGLYEINSPKPESPVLVTTNFSITYFAISNEVEGAGLPAWLLVADAEGMSVLTAWAAGKFDADRIAKAVKTTSVESKISRKRLVLPGAVATLLGEVEETLPGWQIEVGPREAVDAPAFLKLKA